MNLNRKKAVVTAICMVILLCVACGQEVQQDGGQIYRIYYVNNDETNTITREYDSMTTDTEKLLQEMLKQLGQIPDKLEYEAPLANDFNLLGYTLDNGQLILNFDEQYKTMDKMKEILTRAAIVRTVTQIPEISYVSFTVQGEMLSDSSGMAIGTMSADTFIENTGDEINAYEKVNLRLYYANEDGTGLVEENRRNVVYNSNISLEKLVVEQLVKGPMAQGAYPTVNSSTKVVSVSVKDGICYVNFGSDFLSQPYTVSAEVTIYSITNSLVELSNINKVQISVDGETNITFREKFNLSDLFERNLDLLVTPDSGQTSS